MLDQRTILVTGAASGIGEALAEKLSNYELKLILLDKAEQPLQNTLNRIKTGPAEVYAFCCDITDQHSVGEIADKVMAVSGPIDTLVNNAGITMGHGTFIDSPLENQKLLMDVNFWGAVNVMRTFYPQLDTHESPHILNVGSVFGSFPVPDKMAYSISKGALHSLTEGLKTELPEKFTTTLIIPGGVNTNITKNSIGWENEEIKQKALRTSKKTASHSAGDIADRIIKSLRRRKNDTVTVGMNAKIMKWGSRLFPDFFQQMFRLGTAYFSK